MDDISSFTNIVNGKWLRPLQEKEKWNKWGNWAWGEIAKDTEKKRRWGGTTIDCHYSDDGDENKRRRVERKRMKIREENLCYAMNEYEKIVNQKKYMESEIERMHKMVVAIQDIEGRIENGGSGELDAKAANEENRLKKLVDTKYEAEDRGEREREIKKLEGEVDELYDEIDRNREDRIMREFYR